jgi:hypothetical protein
LLPGPRVDLDRLEAAAELLLERGEALARHLRVGREAQPEHLVVLLLDAPLDRRHLARRDRQRRRRSLLVGSGSAGCDSTGAISAGSTASDSAKFPVRHIPTAPTPGPPSSAWIFRTSARSQSVTGLDSCAASNETRG